MANTEERRQLISELKEGRDVRADWVDDHVDASVALQIKVLRQQRGWTQGQLAKRAQLGQSQVSDYENVNHPPPKIGILKRIAAAFDLPLRVDFPSWGDFIDDVSTMGRESYQKPSFAKDQQLEAGGGTRVSETRNVLTFRLPPQATVVEKENASLG